MPGLPPPPLHPLASVSSSPTNLPRRHTSADIRNVQGWQANASLSRQGQHPVPNREGTGQGKAMRPASRSFGGPMPQQPPQLRHSGRNLQMQQSLQYPVMQGMGQGYHAPGRGLYQPDQGVQQFMQPNTSGPQPGAQGWAGKQPPGSAGTWWTGQPVNINGSEPGAQGRVGGHVPQNSSPFQGERTNGTSEKAGSSTYSFTKGDPLSEIDDVLRLPGDKGQLWWRAFTKLRKEISGTRLHEARIEAHHLKENAREDTIAHNAINNLIIALEKTKADILKELITAVPESIVQILDIAKVVQSTLDFKTGGFIWTCLSSVISVSLPLMCILY
jgi:hypothetical protein